MNATELAEIKKLKTALEGALRCKAPESISLATDDLSEELSALFSLVNTLTSDLMQMNRFAKSLCCGDMHADPPPRSNYLAAYLKELHTQLSGLTWAMEQLATGQVVSKFAYKGELFAAFNSLVDRISSTSIENGDAPSPGWGRSVNSWRYHQMLSALNSLHIMVFEVSLEGDVIYANKPAREYLSGIDKLSDKIRDQDALTRHLTGCSEAASFPLFREVYDEDKRAWYKITSDKVEFVDGRLGFLHMVDDISEWKSRERRLKNTATIDELTGVYNRKAGMQAFEELASSESHPGYCVVFIDIDGLKEINDNYGHTAGDHAIKAIADVLSAQIRSEDIVFRYGGDEFLVIFKQCPQDEAAKIIRRMNRSLAKTNKALLFPYRLSFSHGTLSVAPGEKLGTSEIIQKIDGIMYKNKRTKKSVLSKQ